MNKKKNNKRNYKYLLLIFSFFVITFHSFSQKKSISGTVTDANNKTLPGVKISELNTSNTTITDKEGKYTLEVDSGAVVKFDFSGMMPQKVKVEEDELLNVQLKPKKKIKGLVLNNKDEGVADATVLNVTHQVSSATDSSGVFVINGAEGDIIKFSHQEYASKNIIVDDSIAEDIIKIYLTYDDKSYNIGYGEAYQDEYVGAIEKVNTKDINHNYYPDISTVLQG